MWVGDKSVSLTVMHWAFRLHWNDRLVGEQFVAEEIVVVWIMWTCDKGVV